MKTMEKPQITGADLAACSMQPWIAVFSFGGIAVTDWLACKMPTISDLWGPSATQAL